MKKEIEVKYNIYGEAENKELIDFNREVYGLALPDSPIIDRQEYKGRGRPRKTDYTTIRVVQQRYNQIINKYLARPVNQLQEKK